MLVLSLIAHVAVANNAGGFVSSVTTSVTTGTENFNGVTDHYLDNGILRVLVSPNGGVDSIKYLKPGSSGTPKANGTDMVSQFGTTLTSNFGNHKQIYYYWYPDGNGNSIYWQTTGSSNSRDLAYKRTYNPSKDKVAADMEIHYVLGKGNTALYVYLVASHPSSYSIYGDMKIGFIQMIWPVAHDSTNFLCENMYIDNVKTGLSLNGTQQMRRALDTSYYDAAHAVSVAGFPAEISQMTTGSFSGQMTGKYSYNVDYGKLGTWGRASNVNNVGQWVVLGSPEYISNGPTECDYVNGWGLMYFMPVGGHFGDKSITVSGTANWTKTFGPWMLYFNSMTTGTAAWQDAQNQAVAEKAAWPYSWLVNSNYQPKAQRATLTGKLIIKDSMRPGSSASGAWVGLAAPDAGTENAPDNWQFQPDGYQYWVQAAADGTFTIPNVQTFSPYGGAATYQLYAYSSGTSASTGSVGEYSTGPIAIASGSTTNLGTLTWNVPHLGSQPVWDIGIPNRTASEFKHGDEYAKPGLWTQFINEFTNPLEYNVSDNNWSTAINYCHSVDNMATSPWKWHINFNLTSVNQGTYWLNIAYASAGSVQIIRVNDDSSAFATFSPDNAVGGASIYLRQGIHMNYTVSHVAIPWNKLHVGMNTITLDHEVHTNHSTSHFMYDYINLEAPPALVLPPGRDLAWKGGVSSNAWDNSASNWLVSGSATPTVAYVDGDRPVFNDTGSNSPSVTLSGALAPGRVTVSNTTKSYTFGGTGSLNGPMAFYKTGTNTLTISPAQVVVTGTLTSGDSDVSISTTGLAPAMFVSGAGIPASTRVASITSGTSLTLSQNATTTGTSALTFAAKSTCYGGSYLSGGTVVFTNDTANTNGLGTGPITLDGATLQMYDNSNTYNSCYWDLYIPGGSTGTLKADSRVDLYGSLTGGGVLNLYVPYVRTTLFGNGANFLGHINVTTDAGGGDFRVANSNGYPNASINLGPKVTAYSPLNPSSTYPIGELSGDATSVLQGINTGATPGAYTATWSVGGRNTDATFAGSVTNGTSPSLTAITKVGAGKWTLSGPCSYTGPTNVLGGTLRFTGTANGSSGLTIGPDGTLELAGGSLIIAGPGANNGTVRLTGAGSLQTTGTFTNYGIFDSINASGGLPSNFVNQGVVIDSRVVQVQSIAKSGSATQLTIQSYVGHNYQLQRRDTLTSGSWQSTGSLQAGTGDLLSFIDSSGGSGRQCFYRISVSP